MKPELGDEVKCKISGFKGVVVATQQCLTGCDRVHVQAPLNKDGKYGECYTMDVNAVEVTKKGKVKARQVQEETKKGGPAMKVGNTNAVQKGR